MRPNDRQEDVPQTDIKPGIKQLLGSITAISARQFSTRLRSRPKDVLTRRTLRNTTRQKSSLASLARCGAIRHGRLTVRPPLLPPPERSTLSTLLTSAPCVGSEIYSTQCYDNNRSGVTTLSRRYILSTSLQQKTSLLLPNLPGHVTATVSKLLTTRPRGIFILTLVKGTTLSPCLMNRNVSRAEKEYTGLELQTTLRVDQNSHSQRADSRLQGP